MPEKKKNDKLTAKDKQFLNACLTEESQSKAYKKVNPSVSDKSARTLAARKKKELFAKVGAHEYMDKLEAKVVENPGIASAEQVLSFLTDVMEGKVPDQFGLDPALNDRLTAAKMLAQKWSLLTDKVEVSGEISLADTLKAARKRAKEMKEAGEDGKDEI